MRAVLLLALVAGCGDGDGGSDADADSDTDTDTDSDSDSDTGDDPAVCAGLADETPPNMALEDDLFALVTAARADGATCDGASVPPVGPIEMNPAIRCASRQHAREMAAAGAIQEIASEDFNARFRAFGYFGTRFSGTATDEAATAEGAFGEWMGLAGSCNLILNDSYEDFGVGTASGYWSIGFGSTR